MDIGDRFNVGRPLGVLLLLGAACTAADDRPAPVDIPLGYDTCAGEHPCPADLFAALQRHDVVRMRRHSWNLFAGITLMDKLSGVPVFGTWYRKCDLTVQDPKVDCGFEIPAQFHDGSSPDTNKRHGTSSLAVSANFYNPAFRKFIVEKEGLCDSKKLSSLQQESSGKELEDRHIGAFPAGAIAVKTGWVLVKARGFTAVPIWDPEANSTSEPKGNSPGTQAIDLIQPAGRWSRYVAVDPQAVPRTLTSYREVTPLRGPPQRAHIVPLSSFYSVRLQAKDLPSVRKAMGALSIVAEEGDNLALVALHVTTKEIPNWVWATFWWHDRPDDGPFGFDRPSLVLDPWRNYLMNVSYSMNEPRQPDGAPHIAFNPWLEGPLYGGVRSNCMTCHSRAAWPAMAAAIINTEPGEVSPADPAIFSDGSDNTVRFKVDFIWTLANFPVTGLTCPTAVSPTPAAKPKIQ